MKKVFLLPLALMALLSITCNKEEVRKTNYFNIDGVDYSVNYGILEAFDYDLGGRGVFRFTFSDIPIDTNTNTKINAMGTFSLISSDYDMPKSATYIYSSYSASEGNFYASAFIYNNGNDTIAITDGTLYLERASDYFSIDFSLTTRNYTTIVGNYSGYMDLFNYRD